jgi:hypothetical protein
VNHCKKENDVTRIKRIHPNKKGTCSGKTRGAHTGTKSTRENSHPQKITQNLCTGIGDNQDVGAGVETKKQSISTKPTKKPSKPDEPTNPPKTKMIQNVTW